MDILYLRGGVILNGVERRQTILKMLQDNRKPISGAYLSKLLMVSRQVIVADIAILRAEGKEIIATPQGYIIPEYSSSKNIRKVIACIHDSDGIEDELKIIVSLGGRVIDVMVEHPVYGEIRGMLMLTSLFDIDEFTRKLKESVSQPLLVLTGGVHLHTIEAENNYKLDMIENRLRDNGFLVDSVN